MARPKITLYVDVVSPFAYLAYYMLRVSPHLNVHHPVFQSVDITYVPILLGGLMKSCDNRAPLEIRNKAEWINKERRRWAQQFHIPILESPPPNFPRPTLHLQRFLTALALSRPDLLPAALDASYQAFWTPTDNEPDYPDPKVFPRVLGRVLGEDVVRENLAHSTSAAVKQQLMQNTDQAFQRGAFGLPWFHCENARGEIDDFWGFDHLGQVLRFLELDGQGEIRAML